MLQGLLPNEILNYYGLTYPYPVATTATGSTILYRTSEALTALSFRQKLGLCLIVLSLGAFLSANIVIIKLEAGSLYQSAVDWVSQKIHSPKPALKPVNSTISQPQHIPNPLVDTQGKPITPVNTDFALIIPKIGVNTTVIPGVNPTVKSGYLASLTKGVAHASTSFYPNENGTVYLFSHSTNYEWFVKDLNAVFYLIKNLEPGDTVVIMYLGDRYTYKIREQRVVKSTEVGYLRPQTGLPNLILQTCWPPGTSYERLLIFADLFEAKFYGNFDDEIYRPVTFGSITKLAKLSE